MSSAKNIKNKQGLIDQLALNYLKQHAEKNNKEGDEPFILNEIEVKKIKRVRIETLFWACIIGTLGVLCLYLPQYYFPGLFLKLNLELFDQKIEFEYVSIFYGILLIWPEIWALNYINLRAVRIISNSCSFPKANDSDFANTILFLKDAGLEKDANYKNIFEVNPYLGMPKYQFYFIFIITKIKATLSNIGFKILIKRFLGRYAVKEVTDLAGIPVFSFWNAWASNNVVNEAQIRIMAPRALQIFLDNYRNNTDVVHAFCKYGKTIVQKCAEAKRKYNFTQHLMANELIKMGANNSTSIISLDEIAKEKLEVQTGLSQLIVLAFILDGDLSFSEKVFCKQLIAQNWFQYSIERIQEIRKQYTQGKGVLI